VVVLGVPEAARVAVGGGVQRLLLAGDRLRRPDAAKAGSLKGLSAEVGASVTSGATICEIKD
jgi:acetyl-CoA/propionyl-CoA carboxylase biotin carboxyl carrier protein